MKMSHMMKLFCIPFAGGSSLSYIDWVSKLKDDVQIIPVELPGRGYRYDEKRKQSFEEVVEDIFLFINERVDLKDEQDEYALMGHSMGALLTYELYYRIEQEKLRLPQYMIMSAINLPSQFSCENVLKMNMTEFEEYILSMGGFPKGILENETNKKMIIDGIYCDYCILGSYKYRKHQKLIECDSYILCGSKDNIVEEIEVSKWGEFFINPVKQIKIKGGHFFIIDSFQNTMNVIKQINLKRL